MIRVLNIIGSVGYGGAETFLMNIYRKIDRSKYQFDFLICEEAGENIYKEEIEKMGGNIFTVPSKKENLIKNLYSIYKITSCGNYKIVWRHTYNMFKAIDLIFAKIGGAEKTILHAHSTNAKKIESKLGSLMRPLINPFITTRFACGEKAGKFLFREKKYKIIRNGIDGDKFEFKAEVRNRIRKQLNVEDKFVVGHVGRFTEAKNQSFLLDIFADIIKNRKDAILLLVGRGELEEQILEKIEHLALKDKVFLLGLRDDVNEIMQGMDVFIMPSLWEGLPVTLVEAQAADLPCIVSDVIDKSVRCTDNIVFESLSSSSQVWSRKACLMLKKERRSRIEDIRTAGYDINDEVEKIEKYLEEAIL